MPDTPQTRISFEGWFQESYHGSCNGCNRYNKVDGMIPHTVASIHVGGLEFRLCSRCLRVLATVLRQAAKEGMPK